MSVRPFSLTLFVWLVLQGRFAGFPCIPGPNVSFFRNLYLCVCFQMRSFKEAHIRKGLWLGGRSWDWSARMEGAGNRECRGEGPTLSGGRRGQTLSLPFSLWVISGQGLGLHHPQL